MPESDSHRALKQLFEEKMREWFGASIKEYQSSGHELDVFAVTSSGVSIYIEIIWSHSATQFLKDINMLQQSDAHAKVAVVGPEILADRDMIREFAKVVIAQRRQRKVIHGDMLDGQRILEDSGYVDSDLRELFERLVEQAQITATSQATIRLVNVKAVRTGDVQGDFFNVIGKVVCEGNRIVTRLRAGIDFTQSPTRVEYCSVDNSGRVTLLDSSSVNYSWSPDGTDNKNRHGEWPEMRQGDSVFVVFPGAGGPGFVIIPGPQRWWKNFFRFVPGSRYTIKLWVNGISGNQTVSAEEIIEFSP
jgi:hypothetical protein